MYINFSNTFCKLSSSETNVIAFYYHDRYFAFEFPSETQCKFFINAVKGIEDSCKSAKELAEKLKEQEKNINKPNKKGFFSGIKKIFGGGRRSSESQTKVKGFKKEQSINIDNFIVETTNVSSEVKDAYLKHVKFIFEKSGIKKKYLKQPEFRKEVEELLKAHAKEEMRVSQNLNDQIDEEDEDDDDEEESYRKHKSVRIPASANQNNVPPPPPPGFKPTPKQTIEINEEEKGEEGISGFLTPVSSSNTSGSAPPPPPPPAPPSVGGKFPPPPPPAPVFNKIEAKPIKTAPIPKIATSAVADKRHSAQPLTLLEQLKAHKLKPNKPKAPAPPKNENTLASKLEELLAARREELNKKCGSSDSEDESSSDNDSSDFD
jgi:hypothetical protein